MSFSKSFKNQKNGDYRDYTASAIIGDKRQGKSTLIKLLIDRYVKMYPHRKVLVYDVSDAFGAYGDFKGYPLITLDELRNGKKVKGGKRAYWKKGVRRIVNIDYEDTIFYMADSFTDGLLVIDEATVVMTDNPNDKRRSLMIKHTNKRVDIIMIFHALSFVPKRLRGNFWNYYFFKTPDQVTPRSLKAMGYPNPQAFYVKWKESQQAPHYGNRIMQYFALFSRDFQEQ